MRQIIFDLDDTLYDNKDMRKKREKAILKFLGNKKNEYLKLRKNNGTVKSLKILGIEKRQFFNLVNGVEILLKKDLRLIRLFKRLKKKFKIIVLSNSSDFCIQECLEKLGILYFIDECYSGEDFENFKPFKECFYMVQKGDICVGNNFKKDLEIPKQFGAITILIGDSKEADFNIKNIYELENCLEEIEKNA